MLISPFTIRKIYKKITKSLNSTSKLCAEDMLRRPTDRTSCHPHYFARACLRFFYTPAVASR